MEERLAVISLILEGTECAQGVNQLLHEYGEYMIGRMGIPYKQRGVNVITVVLDAPANIINSLSGKLGRLKGVSVKTIYSKKEC